MSDRTATQEFTIRDLLIMQCGKVLTPTAIDALVSDFMNEITKGPTAWAFNDAALAREAALREKFEILLETRACLEATKLNESEQRPTIAERRNASIVGKVDKCKECGSDALFWFAHNTNHSCVQHNRLNTNDITCMFVLGCADCSATLKAVEADTIAKRMTAALKPTESGSSE